MPLDKRTIVTSKRARNKRKKAQRTSAKALSAELALDDGSRFRAPECDSGSYTPTDSSSSDEATPTTAVRAAAPVAAANALANRRFDDAEDTDDAEEDDDDQYDEDEEVVLVCRPTMPDFCTEFVAPTRSSESSHKKAMAWQKMKQFTVRIPAFRETKDGYTTYSVSVLIAGDAHRQFQVERRYSEFVAFASALEQYFASPHYPQLREKLQEASDADGKNEDADEDDNNGNPSRAFQWELPPKTWFRVTQATALEERRSKLESSLQGLLAHDPMVVCHIPIVRDFLMLDIFGAQVAEEKRQCV